MSIPEILVSVPVRYNDFDEKYECEEILVEVLSLHFHSQTMRVRYKADFFNSGNKKVHTVDIDSKPFFKQMKVSSK
jgi:hypothetical protein